MAPELEYAGGGIADQAYVGTSSADAASAPMVAPPSFERIFRTLTPLSGVAFEDPVRVFGDSRS
jgi:hypothetical protein